MLATLKCILIGQPITMHIVANYINIHVSIFILHYSTIPIKIQEGGKQNLSRRHSYCLHTFWNFIFMQLTYFQHTSFRQFTSIYIQLAIFNEFVNSLMAKVGLNLLSLSSNFNSTSAILNVFPFPYTRLLPLE